MEETPIPPGDPGASRFAALEARLAALEQRLPPTTLLSDQFLRRAFAVWGHYFVANFLIGIAIVVVAGFGILLVLFLMALLKS